MSVTADKSQRMMMFVLPLIFVPFVISFPAGLILYWITTNIWTIGQGLVIKRIIPAPVVATAEGGGRPNRHPHRRKKRSGDARAVREGMRHTLLSKLAGRAPARSLSPALVYKPFQGAARPFRAQAERASMRERRGRCVGDRVSRAGASWRCRSGGDRRGSARTCG